MTRCGAYAFLRSLRTCLTADTVGGDLGQRLPLAALRHAAGATLTAERSVQPAEHASNDLHGEREASAWGISAVVFSSLARRADLRRRLACTEVGHVPERDGPKGPLASRLQR